MKPTLAEIVSALESDGDFVKAPEGELCDECGKPAIGTWFPFYDEGNGISFDPPPSLFQCIEHFRARYPGEWEWGVKWAERHAVSTE